MKFLQKDKVDKTLLVISDIHLGAGAIYENRRNYLEDFHHDKEMIDFLQFYSKGDYQNREVELIINGDLFDLLAVPFVEYFDDEFWSEEAAIDKLKLILKAHPEVIQGFVDFVSVKNKKIIFIIGNHDAEFVFPSLQIMFMDLFPDELKERVQIIVNHNDAYRPAEGVDIIHGHEYEIAHQFNPDKSIIEDEEGRRYFIPPWGSYYVTRIINKFKEERDHVNYVRPIKKFLINGLIYDTLFTLRFMMANFFYFFMVRCIFFYKQKLSFYEIWEYIKKELTLFKDYEELTADYFKKNPKTRALIVGHTHEAIFRPYADGTTFINTGTWTKVHHLDFSKQSNETLLTFAQVDIKKEKGQEIISDIALNNWKGLNNQPFDEF